MMRHSTTWMTLSNRRCARCHWPLLEFSTCTMISSQMVRDVETTSAAQLHQHANIPAPKCSSSRLSISGPKWVFVRFPCRQSWTSINGMAVCTLGMMIETESPALIHYSALPLRLGGMLVYHSDGFLLRLLLALQSMHIQRGFFHHTCVHRL